MARTVVPDMNEIWAEDMEQIASMTGLMMTPPPIPLMEPTTVAISTVISTIISIYLHASV